MVPRLRTLPEVMAACLDPAVRPDGALAGWARNTLMAHGDAIANIAEYVAAVATGAVERPPVPSWDTATAQGAWPRVPKWVCYAFRRGRAYYRRVLPSVPDPARLREYVSPEEIAGRIERWRAVLRAPAYMAGSDSA